MYRDGDIKLETPSQIGQDKFVRDILKNKQKGFFVDIGCFRPITISNTFLLEVEDGWSGVGVDIKDYHEDDDPLKSWSNLRPNTKHIIGNATSLNYKDLFEENNVPEIIDYLSLDIEPPDATFQVLFKLPLDNYKFRVITFETDEYRDENGINRTKKSREYLTSKGYELVKSIRRQDDFYIHPDLV
jgi:hypothetical protein